MLTAKRLRELLSYNPETGEFHWLETKGRRQLGQLAGSFTLPERHTTISVDYVRYLAHRLAWLHYYGEWPKAQIDHRDLDKRNNRISNLREATHAQNAHNTPIRKNNTSGFKGVTYHPSSRLWLARITHNNIANSLGYFKTPELAGAAYAKAADDKFGEFARTS